jgi:hypothetical protein
VLLKNPNKMKKNLFHSIIAGTILIGSTLLVSCGDLGVTVTIPYSQEVRFEFDQVDSTGALDTSGVIVSNLDSILAANDADRDYLESITLTELKLTMVDSAGNTLPGGNFNALNNMTAAIANDTVGAMFQNIASLNPVPQNTNPINLTVDTTVVNIVPYLAKPTFKVKLTGGVNTSINTKTYVKAKISFNIRAVL